VQDGWNLIKARPEGRVGIGFVGEVTSMDVKILESLVSNGYSVVSSVAADETDKPITLTLTPSLGNWQRSSRKVDFTDRHAGILKDHKDPSTLLYKLDIQEARRLIATGVVGGGMIPR